MNGKTHIALGLAAAVALGYDPLGAPLAASVALMAGALLPDLDHRNGAGALRRPLPRPLQWLARLPAAIFKHRGPLHSLLVLPPLLLAAERWLGFAPYGRMAALGCVAHLLADALTISGVPLLWPIYKRRFGLPLVRTGGRLERALIPALLALALLAAAMPVGAQEGGPGAWVKVYALGEDHTSAVSCADLAATLAPAQTLHIGECFSFTGAAFAAPGTGIDAFRLCAAGNEAGEAAELFMGYDVRVEAISNPQAAVRLPTGEESGALLPANDAIEASFQSIGAWLAIPAVGPADLWTYTAIANSGGTVRARVLQEVCLGYVASPAGAAPTPDDLPTGEYGALGQIVDLDLGLEIVEKLVGYIGAGNIRDYIALAFGLATLVALFKAPGGDGR